MELKKIPDGSGNTLTVLEYQGRLLPDFPRDAIRGIETFNARSDDVIVCTYPKSGTHWVWEMIRFLLAGTTDLPPIEKDYSMIEFIIPSELEELKSPRILNTHAHFEMMPPEVFKQKNKIVYVTRDPRDVAVSYYHHHRKLQKYYQYDGEWKDYLPLFLEGKMDYESWFAYTRGWEKGIKDHPEIPILITSYEALHANTKEELEKLAKFLGVSASEDFLEEVKNKCNIDVMRQAKGSYSSIVVDGVTVPIMYRKGKTGDWKNWFTVAGSELFNSVFEREMVGTQAYNLYSHFRKK